MSWPGDCSSIIARRRVFACRWVRERASVRIWPKSELAKTPVGAERRPQLRQPLDGFRRWCGGDGRAVERADRRPEHEVGCDACFGQCLQHPHLGRAEQAPSAEHECGPTRRGALRGVGGIGIRRAFIGG